MLCDYFCLEKKGKQHGFACYQNEWASIDMKNWPASSDRAPVLRIKNFVGLVCHWVLL